MGVSGVMGHMALFRFDVYFANLSVTLLLGMRTSAVATTGECHRIPRVVSLPCHVSALPFPLCQATPRDPQRNPSRHVLILVSIRF